jgi:hypothetical protein
MNPGGFEALLGPRDLPDVALAVGAQHPVAVVAQLRPDPVGDERVGGTDPHRRRYDRRA